MSTRINEFGETEKLLVVPIWLIETTQGQVDEGKVRTFMENMPEELPSGAVYGRADSMVKLRNGHHRLEAQRRMGQTLIPMWVANQTRKDGLTKALSSQDEPEFVTHPAIKTTSGKIYEASPEHVPAGASP